MKGFVYEIQIGPYRQIGSTNDVKRRERDHLRLLVQQKHYNQYLQRVYNHYQDFKTVVLFEFESREEAYEKEQELLIQFYGKQYYTMLQKSAIGGSEPGVNSFMYGKTHSEETKKKMSEKQKGRVITETAKLKLSQSRKNLVVCKDQTGQIFVVTKTEYDNNPELVGLTAGTVKLNARKKVYCEQDGLQFSGIIEAANYYKVPPGQISENIKGKRAKVGVKKYEGGLTFKLHLPD